MDNNKKLSPEEQKELQNFKKWLEAKKYSPKNQDEVKKYYAEYQKEKAQASKAQAQKVAHGAKLNYFKSLKNQCAEDEEVVYYKKGGSVGCGCKKKEDGGQVNKAEDGWKTKFKARKQTNQQGNNIGPITRDNPSWKAQKPAPKFKNDYSSKKVKDSEKDYLEGKGDHKVKEKCGGKVKKNEDGSKINKNCGGAVAKFKMHRQGGSLNGVPFIRKALLKKA